MRECIIYFPSYLTRLFCSFKLSAKFFMHILFKVISSNFYRFLEFKIQWAAVLVDKSTKLVIPTSQFVKLNPTNYEEKKKYVFHHKGSSLSGLVLGIESKHT